MNNRSWMPVFAALIAAMPIAACSSTRTSESTGQYVDSSAITAKVKTALLSDDGLKSFQISVGTYKDGVQLSGFVNSQAMKDHAGNVAAAVPGVKTVENDLVLK